MRLVRYCGLGLLALVLLAQGGWQRHRLSADTKPEAKPAQGSPFGQFAYPGAKSRRDYKNEDIRPRAASFTTADDPDKVIKWYKEKIPRLPLGIVEGIASDGAGEPYRETVAAIHDSRSKGAKEKAGRPVTVWVATARVSTDQVEDYTLSVVVTRGKDEALTHIALSFFPGPQAGKPTLDSELVGNWAPAAARGQGVTGLRFEKDRTCRVAMRTKERDGIFSGTYEVAGMEVGIHLPLGANTSLSFNLRVVSVSDKELVIRSVLGVDKEEEILLERK